MARELIFDEVSPSYGKQRVTIFAETRRAFSDESPDDIELDIYVGDVSVLNDVPERMNLTKLVLDGYDFHNLITTLAQFDTAAKRGMT